MPFAENQNNMQEQLASRTLEDSTVFIKEVTGFANQREVLASEDIYARGGMKLVRKGTHLSPGFYDRLIAHKLLKPIEHLLSIDGALDAKAIISLCYEEASRVPSLAPVLDSPELLERMFGLLGDLKIPAPLSLRLSVMQENRPQLFQHSLIAAMIAMVLGIRGRLPREELRALALASLFHDVGELYIDQAMLSQQHQLSSEERRQIYVHPIIGFLMLRDFPELPKGTARAVLQHHERLNGGGYPYRLPATRIDTVSSYLSVAEVVASLLQRQGADKRISMKMRMNKDKYDATAIAIIGKLFDGPQTLSAKPIDDVFLINRLGQMAKLFNDWNALRKTFSPADVASISTLIERVDSLRMLMIEPGFDESNFEEIMMMANQGDPELCAELTVLLDELEWQFRDFARETERHLFSWNVQATAQLKESLDQWFLQLHQIVSE